MANLTPFEKDMKIIAKLDDEPNDVGGLSATDLKAKFDEGGEAIKEYINNSLLNEIETETSGDISAHNDDPTAHPAIQQKVAEDIANAVSVAKGTVVVANCYDAAAPASSTPNTWYVSKDAPRPTGEAGMTIDVRWQNGRVGGIGYDVSLIWGEPGGADNETILGQTNTADDLTGEYSIPTEGTVRYQLEEKEGRKHWRYVSGKLIPKQFSSATDAAVADKIVPGMSISYLPGMEIYVQMDNGNTADVMRLVPDDGPTLPVYGNGIGPKTGELRAGTICHLVNAGDHWQIVSSSSVQLATQTEIGGARVSPATATQTANIGIDEKGFLKTDPRTMVITGTHGEEPSVPYEKIKEHINNGGYAVFMCKKPSLDAQDVWCQFDSIVNDPDGAILYFRSGSNRYGSGLVVNVEVRIFPDNKAYYGTETLVARANEVWAGTVKAKQATPEQTQDVSIDGQGFLKTRPGVLFVEFRMAFPITANYTFEQVYQHLEHGGTAVGIRDIVTVDEESVLALAKYDKDSIWFETPLRFKDGATSGSVNIFVMKSSGEIEFRLKALNGGGPPEVAVGDGGYEEGLKLRFPDAPTRKVVVPGVLDTTGGSTVDTMSQAAITSLLEGKANKELPMELVYDRVNIPTGPIDITKVGDRLLDFDAILFLYDTAEKGNSDIHFDTYNGDAARFLPKGEVNGHGYIYLRMRNGFWDAGSIETTLDIYSNRPMSAQAYHTVAQYKSNKGLPIKHIYGKAGTDLTVTMYAHWAGKEDANNENV